MSPDDIKRKHDANTGTGESLKITDKLVRSLQVPAEGYTVDWDGEIKGFGIRVTAAGVRSFVLRYRFFGDQKVYTIGTYPEWTVIAARSEAIELKAGIRVGQNPVGERKRLRNEPSFGDLLDDYIVSEEFKRKRPRTQKDYKRMCEKILRPAWGSLRLKAIQPRDVEALHASMKSTPYQANRVVSLASRLFNFAIEEKQLEDNPAKNIEHYHEEKRARFLDQEGPGEMARLSSALDSYSDQSAADALRLLLLTGSRSGEVLQARWEHFNLHTGIWTKPSSSTKQKKVEHVPLNDAALELLASMRNPGASGPLFPGSDGRKARKGLRRPWLQICKAAGLVDVYQIPCKRRGKDGLPVMMLKRYRSTVRLHDLRHTFASHLVSNGVPLQQVGKLLGHSQAQTTMRYAHLSNTALKDATNVFGNVLKFATAKRA